VVVPDFHVLYRLTVDWSPKDPTTNLGCYKPITSASLDSLRYSARTTVHATHNTQNSKMTFFAPQFQIVSDLHLETPMNNPQYLNINLTVNGSALFLLGDIGLVIHENLFVFLCDLLDRNRGCRIFYVLGNHEAYHTTFEYAVERMREFEQLARREYGGRFRLLCRDRFDLNEKVSILGCTLWSNIQPEQAAEVGSRMTDYNEERGIQKWSPERSCEEHAQDLEWLNAQVQHIQTTAPHRSVIIATHHCPTVDARATDPRHAASSMNSGFVTDLSREVCWTSPVVKVWAFGHTHYSCAWRDEGTGVLVVSNQKGYGGRGRRVKGVVVEEKGEEWQVLRKKEEEPTDAEVEPSTTTMVEEKSDTKGVPDGPGRPKTGLFDQATKRVKALFHHAPST